MVDNRFNYQQNEIKELSNVFEKEFEINKLEIIVKNAQLNLILLKTESNLNTKKYAIIIQ